MSGSKASHMATSDGRITGVCVSQCGSSSRSKENNRVQYMNGGDEDGGPVGVKPPGASISLIPVGEEGVRERSKSNSPYLKKGLADLGEPFSHPRRSARLSLRYAQVASSANHRNKISLTSISDKDINNCNSRLHHMCVMEEPPNLWEVGKKCGLFCRGEEDEVIKEYGSMEERDLEVVNCYKEGIEKCVL